MNNLLRPKVGVSACLLGESVRYDGGHQLMAYIEKKLAPYLDLMSFCPEVHAGLGIPRPPVELIASDNEIVALGRDDPSLDVTKQLQFSADFLVNQLIKEQAVAYIFKARSPSCGVGTTPLFGSHGEDLGLTSGLVAAQVKLQLPDILLVDEGYFVDDLAYERFVSKCLSMTL
ncbi:MAG: DUF523 domain-containing protein [Pseudomonadales bacterium]